MLRRVVWWTFADISEELTVIAFMIQALSFFETSVNIYQTTRRDDPENSCL
jgi:hypothetical protein